MKKCHSLHHPHCTYRVAEGEAVCTAGHVQAQDQAQALDQPQVASRYDLIVSGGILPNFPKILDATTTAPEKLHLHFSGYDPRAAGGRQSIRLELRGMLSPLITQIDVQLRSELIATGASTHRFLRTLSGAWQALLINFSSKNKEHGQYPIEVALLSQHEGTNLRKWVCTAVIFVPRADASLTEIHRVFLATQKSVRLTAEDGAIASLTGLVQADGYAHGNLDIEVNAKDAAIAKLDMRAPAGKYEIALGTIAWDEELIEVAPEANASPVLVPATSTKPPAAQKVTSLPHIDNATSATNTASLISDAAQECTQFRLFALDEWVFGRMEADYPKADILLSHRAGSTLENASLTRRISAAHTIIRRRGEGAEIMDISRYGTLVDGIALKKEEPYPLRAGMQIEFCASVRGIVKLQVIAIQAHAIVMAHMDARKGREVLFLIQPETRPGTMKQGVSADLPTLFHSQGSFWHRDTRTQREVRLDANTSLAAWHQLPAACRYFSSPYADTRLQGYGAWRDEQQRMRRPRTFHG
ncbi:FHA domain-containing protein [Undibacterium sp. TJN19]|uniref:FHA domain-containing protein n=1 Tax=Undibacterium sp. TJN19 TaxID=3413055 RepID=UPI003BEFEB4A